MKKLFFLLLLPLLLAACEDKPEEKNYDEQLLGTWKVVYSKTMDPAQMINGELVIGENPYVVEYFEGEFRRMTGIFSRQECKLTIQPTKIEVEKCDGGGTFSFTVKVDKVEKTIYDGGDIFNYQLVDDTLTIIRYPQSFYVISKYTKVN